MCTDESYTMRPEAFIKKKVNMLHFNFNLMNIWFSELDSLDSSLHVKLNASFNS